MPLGTTIHNIEITLGKGGQLARAVGAVAKLIAKEGKSATLKLPSGEVRLISKNCSATVGQVGNVGVNQKSLGRAGSKCWLGKRPVVRGVVMNPIDHPHGGGEGKALIGRKNLNRTMRVWKFIRSMDGAKNGVLVRASRPILLPDIIGRSSSETRARNALFRFVPVLHFLLLESKGDFS
ncbi:50s ribosomal protein l2 [Quercus suber]|uniref:50s ribosomal protein l2 n=1 Tax=Quercus suber TaxID=58331 RepID=A0AAW0L6N3_QUESU